MVRAAQEGTPTDEGLDYLLAAGADVNAFDARSIGDSPVEPSPLLVALHRSELRPDGHPVLDACALRLINAGADIHARNASQMRPLDCATVLPSLDVFNALIAKGADPTPTPFVGTIGPGKGLGDPGSAYDGVQLGLHYLQVAIHHGRADVLRAAAAAGVNLTKVRILGRMPYPLLSAATCYMQPTCVRVLLDLGADVNEVVTTSMGRSTVVDIAQHLFGLEPGDALRLAIMAILRAAGGKRYDEL